MSIILYATQFFKSICLVSITSLRRYQCDRGNLP